MKSKTLTVKEGFLEKEREGRNGGLSQAIAEDRSWTVEVPHAPSQLAFAKVLLLINLGASNCFFSESNTFYSLVNSQTRLA